MSCLYILDINHLLITPFANIFSHPAGCIFVLFMVFFAARKLLSLIKSNLFIFALISFAYGDGYKKILLQFISENILPMFSSRGFMVSCLIFLFKPFWAYFSYGEKECSNFIGLHAAVQLSQHHLLKKFFFLFLFTVSIFFNWSIVDL